MNKEKILAEFELIEKKIEEEAYEEAGTLFAAILKKFNDRIRHGLVITEKYTQDALKRKDPKALDYLQKYKDKIVELLFSNK